MSSSSLERTKVADSRDASSNLSSFWKIALVLSLYLSLLAYHGYRYGDEDLSETSAYALYLTSDSLYSQDLYIQHVSENRWNERYPFVYLLSVFNPESPWTYFGLHGLCSLAILIGLLRLISPFVRSNVTKTLFIIAVLFATYGYTLGENEVWYNYIMPSLPAKALALWSLVMYVQGRRWWAYFLLIPATLCQPIAGAQMALIWLLLDAWKWRQNETTWQTLLGPIMLYGGTAGAWVLAVYLQQAVMDHELTNRAFYEIMELRLGHHFFPSYYPTKNWAFMLSIYICAMVFWRSRNQTIYRFLIVSAIGCLFYLIAIEGFEISSVLVLQWFKTTVWIKIIGLLAVLVWSDRYLSRIQITYATPLMVLLMGFSSLAILQWSDHVFSDKRYHFPWSQMDASDFRIAQLCTTHCAVDAAIITPPELTSIRFFAKRGVYIDYKSNIHSRTYLAESQARRERLYGLTLQLKRTSANPALAMQEHYSSLTQEDIQIEKDNGATHLVTYETADLPFRLLGTAGKYVLYEL
ncbi:MAG: hypothetical protein KTR24_07245 [Saprospiraceae bacterium]|nr:hypothetical protein [Saprospiraceae bacterium]